MKEVKQHGCLVAVVGPSGAGKDSVMRAIAAREASIVLVRRTMTRAPGQSGEVYDAVRAETFDAAAGAGAFCLHWRAHGLRYGIPASVLGRVQAGETCLVNLSRSVLREAAAVFPALVVLNITASAPTRAARLSRRGRETAQDIAQRLSRAVGPLPEGLDVTTLCNEGALEQTVDAALRALYPVRA